MDHRSLAGTDERAPLRRKAWDALGKWIASRVSRQRGVHVPNLFQICFRLVATDDSGSKLRRPVFLLSERFADNFGVKQGGYVEKGLPAPQNGDDVNFYQLAIQHSEGLTKDQAFANVRDMVFRFGEAASQGKELKLDLGCGCLVVKEREVSFDFSASGNAGGSSGGEREKVSHLDPMLNGGKRGSGSGGADVLSIQGGGGGGSRLSSNAGRGGSHRPRERHVTLNPTGGGAGGSSGSALLGGADSRSALGGAASALGGAARSGLSAEEEAALFADIDLLDPETLALSSNLPVTMRVGELGAKDQQSLGDALKIDPSTLGDQTVETVQEQLHSRAAALEAQLAAQRQMTDAIEARLKKAAVGGDAARQLAMRDAGALKQTHGRRGGASPSPVPVGSPELIPALSVAGSSGGGSAASKGGGSAAAARNGAARRGGGGGSAPPRKAEPAGPVLSVGFTSEGPGGAAHIAPLNRKAVQAKAAAEAEHSGPAVDPYVIAPIVSPKPVEPPVMIIARTSDIASSVHTRGSKVPVAPPLPPFRYAPMQPNDAANRAWKQHANPTGSKQRRMMVGGVGGGHRSVGGPAPPFLAAPPVVAAQGLAARQGA